MKMAEATEILIEAVSIASMTAKKFESSMKGVSQAMSKIQPKKLSAHGLSREVVNHYSDLFARRIGEGVQRGRKKQKREIKKEVIKKKLAEKKNIPKKLKNKLETYMNEDGEIVTRRKQQEPVIYTGKVEYPPIHVHKIRVKEVNDKIEDLETESAVPDVLNERIRKKAQKILRKKPELREPHIDAERFKRLVAEEIEREILQEEQRDLQEKVVLKRRRKVIRKKR